MKKVFIALSFFAAAGAAAAPMSIERRFVPESQLVDARFAAENPASVLAVDHSKWNAFLSAYVVAAPDGVNRVRYDAARLEGRAALDAYVAELEKADIASLSRREQIAFWINLYNAATVRLILDHPGVRSIRDIKQPWDLPVATIAGRAMSLNEIEHGVIRPIARDARIHYAVNCASIGCPNLARQAYSGADLEAGLDAAARAYVNHPRGVSVAKDKVTLSKIYGWYRADFGADDAAVLDHIRAFADPGLKAALAGKRKVSAYRYDWALNSAD